jgi:hypothetical protein
METILVQTNDEERASFNSTTIIVMPEEIPEYNVHEKI